MMNKPENRNNQDTSKTSQGNGNKQKDVNVEVGDPTAKPQQPIAQNPKERSDSTGKKNR